MTEEYEMCLTCANRYAGICAKCEDQDHYADEKTLEKKGIDTV